ncbi:MAG: phosphatidate cytidylyltransferase [Thermoanaerobaculia bacterium]
MALKRELAAAVAIPIVLAILFTTPPVVFDVLVAGIALCALWEFYRLAEKTGHPVSKTVGMLGGLVTMLMAPLATSWHSNLSVIHLDLQQALSFWVPGEPLLRWCLIGTIAACLGILISKVPPAAALAGAGSTLFGVFLVVLPAWSLCFIRSAFPPGDRFGSRAVLYLLGIVWICDSCAYYFGKRWGRRKLAPVVSPNKTWEGAIAGLIGATLFGAIAGAWILLPEFGPLRGALAGAVASSAGQLGDLVESLWKRGAGVKDSGVFLPGHGGFYDRIDSLLFAGPVLAAFVATL